MIKAIFLLSIILIFYFLITDITYYLNVFYYGTNVLLTILFAITILTYKQKDIAITSYFLFVIIFLLFRKKTQPNISLDFYLWNWLKLITNNKVVLFNIIGNIFVFTPLVFYFNNRYSFYTIIIIVLIIEFMQFFTKRGVFDIVDIFLNTIGIIIGTIIKRRIYGK